MPAIGAEIVGETGFHGVDKRGCLRLHGIRGVVEPVDGAQQGGSRGEDELGEWRIRSETRETGARGQLVIIGNGSASGRDGALEIVGMHGALHEIHTCCCGGACGFRGFDHGANVCQLAAGNLPAAGNANASGHD